jgi:hypothetical protein
MPSSPPSRPALAALAAIVLLAAAVLGARGARFDDDPLAALPADDVEVRAFRDAAGPFGTLDTLLIGVEREDLFAKDSLDRLRKFARDAAVVKGVAEVVCFTEVPLIKVGTSTTEVADLVPRPIPADPARLDQVRRDVLTNDLVVGNLVARDGQAALIPIRLDRTKRPLRETAREVADLAQTDLEGARVVVDGAPGAALGLAMAQTSAAPLIGIVVVAALLLAPLLLLRRAWTVLLALLAAGLTAAAALLPSALLGDRLGPSAMVALLGAAGAALAVACYVLLAPDPRSARARGAGPVAQGAAAWNAVAALSLVLGGADSAALLLLAGALASLACTALVLPALVSTRAIDAAPSAAPRARPLLAALLTVACAAAYLGVPRLRAAVDPGEAFPPGSGPYNAEQFLLRHFDGTATIIVAVRGDVATPEVLDALRALESAALGDPAVLSVTSLLGPVRTQGKAYGRPSELPPNPAGVRKFFFLAGGQPGLSQLVRSAQDAAAVLVKIDPHATVADAVRVRDALSDAVPSAMRYVSFAGSDPQLVERLKAELFDRLGERLARLGIAAERRTTAFLRDLLERIAAGAGPDVEALRTRIGEHFSDGTTYVLVKDLESNEPIAVGETERGRLAEAIAAAGTIDDANVRAALLAVFPAAGADAEGLDAEARILREVLGRVATEGAGRNVAPPFVQEWALTETGDPERAERALAELLAASSELRFGGIALPSGDGVPLHVRVGGMPLASASVRLATVRSLTTGFLVAAVLGLVLWSLLFLAGEGGPSSVGPSCSVGWSGALAGVGRAIPITVVPLVAASLAFGGAGLLGLPGDPGLPITLAVAVVLGGTLASLLLMPATSCEPSSAPCRDGRRTALHLGPALAAVGLGLSLIPLPPARTIGLVLAVACLAATILGWVHSGRR